MKNALLMKGAIYYNQVSLIYFSSMGILTKCDLNLQEQSRFRLLRLHCEGRLELPH